jgi:hypothetical protein
MIDPEYDKRQRLRAIVAGHDVKPESIQQAERSDPAEIDPADSSGNPFPDQPLPADFKEKPLG